MNPDESPVLTPDKMPLVDQEEVEILLRSCEHNPLVYRLANTVKQTREALREANEQLALIAKVGFP